MPELKTAAVIAKCVKAVVAATPVIDVHTHIYPASFRGLLLWGIDELLTYHYLVAEVMRRAPIDPERFLKMGRTEQADLIWEHLYLANSPVSEACRGPLTCLKALDVSVKSRELDEAREYFRHVTAAEYVDIVFEKAKVRKAVMTNDPFDPVEHPFWTKGGGNRDPRFVAALRIDRLFTAWPDAAKQLKAWGYRVNIKIDRRTAAEVRRFLLDWTKLINAAYMAASLEDTFVYPDRTPRTTMLKECVLPAAREAGVPFAAMIGVRRQINPRLKLAGDGVGPADCGSVEALCRDFPDNRFLVTMLSRVNQHQLTVIARKFPNLMIFGCWWFLNDPSIIEEMTRMRVELLGTSFIPQHSDARVLDQLIYKWRHSREIIAKVLTEKYCDAAAAGWPVTRQDVVRDVANWFGGNFEKFLAQTPKG
jgi:hypothetical protein